jgi:hypothetical protein
VKLENVILAAVPFAGLVYLAVLLSKDIRFYRGNNFDFSKNSGVPDFWIRLGPAKYVLTPDQRFKFGYPIFSLILVGLIALLLFAKVGPKL